MSGLGSKGHEDRLENLERQMRRVTEQVGQLSIDLGVTRTQLRHVYLLTQKKVDSDEVDASIIALNDLLRRAQVHLTAAQVASDEEWARISDELDRVLSQFRSELENAIADMPGM